MLLAEKYKLAQLVTNAMAPYVGKTIDAGVTLYSILAPWIADYNGSIGNTGFKVTATSNGLIFSIKFKALTFGIGHS